MASHVKRTTKEGKTYYQIRVSRGYGLTPYTRSWYPQEGWGSKTIARELAKAEAAFEQECVEGNVQNREQLKEAECIRKAEEAKIQTLYQYAEQVFMPYKVTQRKIAEKTRRYYQNALDSHIYKSKLRDMKINSITKAELSAFLMQQEQSGIGYSTLTGIYLTLRQIFDLAFCDDVISINPMAKVKRPKQSKEQRQLANEDKYAAFDIDEVLHIQSCLENEPLKWRAFTYLLMDSGMRKGEALALKWRDVNFTECTIHIHKNLCYTPEQGVYEGAPKTESSIRVIDISPDVAELLKDLKKEQAASKVVSQYIFTQDGEAAPMHPDSPARYFQRFGKRYGIKDFHPHKLRHTFASIAITNGADVASVSQKLGHKSKATTLDMYTHADQASIRRAGDVFREAVALKKQA